jgi:hypothetical protein
MRLQGLHKTGVSNVVRKKLGNARTTRSQEILIANKMRRWLMIARYPQVYPRTRYHGLEKTISVFARSVQQ